MLLHRFVSLYKLDFFYLSRNERERYRSIDSQNTGPGLVYSTQFDPSYPDMSPWNKLKRKRFSVRAVTLLLGPRVPYRNEDLPDCTERRISDISKIVSSRKRTSSKIIPIVAYTVLALELMLTWWWSFHAYRKIESLSHQKTLIFHNFSLENTDFEAEIDHNTLYWI